jgi:hypothetical protein
MWKPARRRQDQAANAIALVVQEAILLIRAMAYRREAFTDTPFVDAEDYQEQIRRLADLCDTLVPGLRRGVDYRPTDALQYTWDSREEDQRRFLQDVLAGNGISITDFIVDRHATTT